MIYKLLLHKRKSYCLSEARTWTTAWSEILKNNKRCGTLVEKLARLRSQPQGTVPVGDIPRRIPLLRPASGGRHRQQRARSRFCDPLGLRLADGPVRNLAGRRLEGSGALDCRRHCRGQDDGEHRRCPLGSQIRARPGSTLAAWLLPARVKRAYLARSQLPVYKRQLFSGCSLGEARHVWRDDIRDRRRALLAYRRRHRHRQLQEPHARDRR